jgi:phosphoribosylformylglycinamidine synthase
MRGRRDGRAWLARVSVGFKAGVLDPQGKTVKAAAGQLGFRTVEDIRMGKHFWVRLSGGLSRSQAEAEVRRLADRLLVNPVIESYDLTLDRERTPG